MFATLRSCCSRRHILVAAASISLAAASPAQASVRGWGMVLTDTEARHGKFEHVAAQLYQSAVLRDDGRIFTYGGQTWYGGLFMPEAPAGLRYVDLAQGIDFTLGLLSDGTVLGAGSIEGYGFPIALPALPVGTRYVDICGGGAHVLMLRSDGALVASGSNSYGQLNLPAFPAGTRPIKLAASFAHSVVLLSDGSIVASGDNSLGLLNIPLLPPGLRYVDVAVYSHNMAAVRSDGVLLVWGDNRYGQCNVPSGSYLLVALGDAHTSAWRTDGTFVSFGDNTQGQLNPPMVPAGVVCTEMACGNLHTVARMSDGSVLGWGTNVFMQASMPTVPADPVTGQLARIVSAATGGPYFACVLADGTLRLWGHRYLENWPLPVPNEKFTRVELGWGTAVAMRTDGSLVAWGDNTSGRATVPTLPPGVRYTDFDECWSHTVALRSDGAAVTFGNSFGALPPLPSGLRYVDADAEDRQTVLLRSDGTVFSVGAFDPRLNNVPPIAPGLRYVQVAHCNFYLAALRSDGTLAIWPSMSIPLPPLPPGVVYVEISGGDGLLVARRSDGQVVAGGSLNHWEQFVPSLDPGTSYVEVDGGDQQVAARVGPTRTYVSFAAGCGGSRPSARLVPADTPCIGATFRVRAFDLPTNVALLVLGFGRTPPMALDFAGMPGCASHVTIDSVDSAVGQLGNAEFAFAIPDRHELVGVHFFHQAVVLDPGANAAGAVVSDAAEGVVGER